ncbi:hypothetical protein AAFF39_05355 [Lactococcus garvieae]
MKNLSLDTIKTIIAIVSTIASIILGYSKIKSLKLPQVIQISKLLLENTFSWGIANIEPHLYHNFNYEIQIKLREFKSKNEEYLIYFDRNFVRLLNNLCDIEIEPNTKISPKTRQEFKIFSGYYLSSLKTAQKIWGLSHILMIFVCRTIYTKIYELEKYY